MTEELKPCPFCGSDAIFDHYTVKGAKGKRWEICCGDPDCIAYSCQLACFKSEFAALAAWNTRSSWQLIETAPKDVKVLLWFISINPENTHAHAVTIGEVSSHEEGKVWASCGAYLPIEIYTHWQPLPDPPEEE